MLLVNEKDIYASLSKLFRINFIGSLTLGSLSSKDNSYLSLAVLWGIFFVGFSVRIAVITTMPLIREDLHMSVAQAGLLLSLLNATYGIIQFPSGILADIYDNKRLLILVTLSLALALTGVSLSSSLLIFATCLLLMGLFVGFSLPVSFSILSKTFLERIGAVMGFYNTAPPIAQFFGSYISGILAIEYDWHFVYYVWILIDLGLAVLVWRFVKTTETKVERATIDREAFKNFFLNKPLMYFLVSFVAHSVCAFSVLSMTPLFIVEVHKLDVALTATIYGGTRLLGFVGSFMGGYLSDRFSKVKMLLISLTITAICIYFFITLPFGPWMVAILGLQAISINLFFPTIYALIVGLTPPSIRGKTQGLYNSISFTIGGMAPSVIGLIADFSSFRLAFMFPVVVAIMGIAWILYLIIKDVPEVLYEKKKDSEEKRER